MKVADLHDGMTVECRTGRAGRDSVEWDGPWHNERLYVKWYNGRLVTITLMDRVWAEGSMQDFCEEPEGGLFLVEDWYLQIRGLER